MELLTDKLLKKHQEWINNTLKEHLKSMLSPVHYVLLDSQNLIDIKELLALNEIEIIRTIYYNSLFPLDEISIHQNGKIVKKINCIPNFK